MSEVGRLEDRPLEADRIGRALCRACHTAELFVRPVPTAGLILDTPDGPTVNGCDYHASLTNNNAIDGIFECDGMPRGAGLLNRVRRFDPIDEVRRGYVACTQLRSPCGAAINGFQDGPSWAHRVGLANRIAMNAVSEGHPEQARTGGGGFLTQRQAAISC
ncbi:MAG: hypothetical protein ABR564_06485 [Candidatus Dormibacteria bacterium]